MYIFFRSVPKLLWFALLATVAVSCKDDCEDVVCAPCPSSRFIIQYQDSMTGACVPSFHASAWIYGMDVDSPNDTLRRYNLADSCTAAILVQEGLFYHLVAGSIRDTIVIDSFSYQPPVAVTECCLCYPVEHVDFTINGKHEHVEWAAGLYENAPFIRKL